MLLIILRLFSKINRKIEKLFESHTNDNILIISPHINSFGAFNEDVFFSLLAAKIKKKKILFLYPYSIFRKYFSNEELKSIESEYIFKKKNFKVFLLHISYNFYFSFKLLQKLIIKKYLKVENKLIFYDTFIPMIGKRLILNYLNKQKNIQDEIKYFPQINLRKDKKIICETNLKNLGINLNDWYVCLHTRDINYPRNVSLNTYQKAINYIKERGGWVIRVGEEVNNELNNSNLINLHSTKYNNDLMNLHIIKNCKMFLGCGSGVNQCANLFGKKILASNLLDWSHAIPLRKGDSSLIKHYFNHQERRFLSLKEIFNNFFKYIYYSNYIPKNISIINNTEEEIFNLVKNGFNSFSYSKKQIEFQNLKKLKISNELKNYDFAYWDPMDDYLKQIQINRIKIMSQGLGTIDNEFLEENWEYNRLNGNQEILKSLKTNY